MAILQPLSAVLNGLDAQSKRRCFATLLITVAVLGLSSCGNSDPKACDLPPTISSMTPSLMKAGSQEFSLTVTGDFFNVNSVVQWNEGNRQTTVVNSNRLTAVIPETDIADPGTAYVRVETPLTSDGGNVRCAGDSESLRFTINR
ncbi:MAG TPA: IPT/TIG domain-containing protein [Terracidiphilus sp.]|jgi:hypothetical protein